MPLKCYSPEAQNGDIFRELIKSNFSDLKCVSIPSIPTLGNGIQKSFLTIYFCTTFLDLCYKFQVPNFKTLYGLLYTFFAKLLNRFDIIFNSYFIALRKGLFKLTELFTGVSMITHWAIHRRSSDYPKNNFLSLELAMGSDMKTQKM